MAVGTVPRASWLASVRSRRIGSSIVASHEDGPTMHRERGHAPDGEMRGVTFNHSSRPLVILDWGLAPPQGIDATPGTHVSAVSARLDLGSHFTICEICAVMRAA